MTYRETTADELLPALAALLPPGPIWDLEGDERLRELLLALAEELARLHTKIGSLVDEVDPRTTDDLLLDWERVAELPEPGDTSTRTTDERRAILHAKLTAVGGQSAAYFKRLADKATGQDCTIRDYASSAEFRAGTPESGPRYGIEWRFHWEVVIPGTDVLHFRAGLGAAGDPLSSVPAGVRALYPILDRVRPAHAAVLYFFPDDDPAT